MKTVIKKTGEDRSVRWILEVTEQRYSQTNSEKIWDFNEIDK